MASLEDRQRRRNALNAPAATVSQSQSALESRRARRAALGGTTVSSTQGTSVEAPNAFMRGLNQSSGAILAGQGLTPEEAARYAKASEDQNWFSGLLEAAGGFVGDIPVAMAGALGGGAAGAAITGPAAPIGGVIGAGAGGFALPSMVRGAYNEYLQLQGHPEFEGMSMEEVALKVAGGGAIEGVKGAATGALVALVPYLGALKKVPGLNKVLSSPMGSKVAQALDSKAFQTGAEIATLTIAPAAMEGRLPSLGEFATNAALLGGFKAAMKIPSIGRAIDDIRRTKGLKTEEEVLASVDAETKANLENAKSQSEFNDILLKYKEKVAADAAKLEEDARVKAAEEQVEINKEAKKATEEGPKDLIKIAEKGLKEREAIKSEKEQTKLESESKRVENVESALEDYKRDKAYLEKDTEAKKAEIKKALAQEIERIKQSKATAAEKKSQIAEMVAKANDLIKGLGDANTQLLDPNAKRLTQTISKATKDSSKAADSLASKAFDRFTSVSKAVDQQLTKQTDRLVKQAELAHEKVSLPEDAVKIEQNLEKQIKEATARAEAKIAAEQARLERQVSKIKDRLSEDSDLASKLKDSKLEGLEERFAKKLDESLTKMRDALTKRKEEYTKQVEASRQKKLAKARKQGAKSIEEAQKEAARRLSEAEETVRLARETGYFEIEANKLDPTEPPGKMIKKSFVSRRPGDKGKSSLEVVQSRIVDGKREKLGTGRSTTASLFDQAADLKKINPDQVSKNPGFLLEHIRTAWHKIRSIVEDGVFDYNTYEVTYEGFSKILSRYFGNKPVDLKKLDAHLAAQTSIDRQNLGQRNNVPTQDALNLVNGKDPYALAARDIAKMQHAYLDRLVDAGMVSREGAVKMKEMYGLYAPLLRAIEPNQAALYQSKSFLPKQTIKKAVGSERDIISPSSSILENITAGEFSIAKNDMARELGHHYMKEGVKRELVDNQPLTVEQLQEMVGGDIKVNEETAKLLNDFRNQQDVGAVPGGFIHWFENGKKYRVKVDPATHEIVSGATKLEIGMGEKLVANAKNYFSTAVTIFPTDVVRLGIMDWITSGIQTKFPLLTHLSAIPEAIADAFFRKGTYREWIRSGKFGMDDVLSQGDFKYASETFSNALEKGDKSAKETAISMYDFVTAPLRFLQDVAARLGDVPRLAEYNNTIRKAKADAKRLGIAYDPKEASHRAAQNSYEVTTTYGREGASKTIQMLNRLVPFARTIITSTQTFAKSIDPRTAQGRTGLMRAGAGLALPTLYFYLKNRGDPRYQALTQEQKDNYIWIYTGNDPNEEPIKLRKFWQYGWLFQTLPEKLAEFSIENDPKALNGLMRAFEFEFSPVTILNISESFNKGGVTLDPDRLFQGRYSTVPKRLENLDPEFQELETTSETAKFLGHKLGVLSPVWWDHAASMFGAKFGKEAMKSIDELLIAGHVAPDSKMAEQLSDSVLFGSLYGRGPGKSTAHINKFYDIFQEQDARYKTYNRLLNQGRDKEAEDYIARKPFLPNKMLQNMRKNISRLYKQIQEVEGRVNKSPSDRTAKRKEWQELVNELTSLAKEYSDDLDGALKELGKSSS